MAKRQVSLGMDGASSLGFSQLTNCLPRSILPASDNLPSFMNWLTGHLAR